MNTKHWKVTRCDPLWSDGEHKPATGRIVELRLPPVGEEWGQAASDAALIEAAPDLLAACEAAIAACNAIYDGRLNWHGSLHPLELICKANKAARAAIAKATGQ